MRNPSYGLGLPVLLIVSVMSIPATGHHSTAGAFDINRTVIFDGVITSVEWINPHVLVYLDIKEVDGKPKTIVVEGLAPGVLSRVVPRDMLKAGMRISTTGFPSRDAAYAEKNRVDPAKASVMVEGGEMKLPGGEVIVFGRGPAFGAVK